MPDYTALERICAQAVCCNRCFPKMAVVRPSVNLAQPRYVGPNYWSSKERRLLLMINPGAGDEAPSDQAMRRDLISYRDQTISLEQLFERQRAYFAEWGRGKFLPYVKSLGGPLASVALLNVAWCSTQGDKYPTARLQTSLDAYTKRAIEALQPTTIVACGDKVQAFARNAGPSFVPAPHFAARFAIDFDKVKQEWREFAAPSGARMRDAAVSALDESSRGEESRNTSQSHRDPYSGVIRLLVGANPKMPTSKSFLRFACYRDGMTVADYRALVVSRLGPVERGKCLADLRWDVAHHFIRIEPR